MNGGGGMSLYLYLLFSLFPLNEFLIFLFCSHSLSGFRGAGRFLVYFLNFSCFTLLMERSLFLFSFLFFFNM